MATIKDGMKIGFGLLLLKWLLGAGSCAVTVGVLSCLLCNMDGKKAHRTAEAPAPTVPQARTGGPAKGQAVRYPKGCNVRADPKGSAAKVGFASAGKSYAVQERQGQWRKIRLDDGTEGWAACAVGSGRPASRPTTEEEE